MAELNGHRRFRPMWQSSERATAAGARDADWRGLPGASPHPNQTDATPGAPGVACPTGSARPPAPANRAFGGALDQAIGAAVARALEHERRSRHGLEIRFSISHGSCRDELTIIAGIADPDWAALDDSQSKSVRRIAWSDVEPRACELPGLVDEAVAELEESLDLVQRDQTRIA